MSAHMPFLGRHAAAVERAEPETTRIVVVPHWRAEVDDLARTLVDCGATGRDGGARVATGARAIAALASDMHDSVLLLSDSSARRLQRLVDRHRARPAFRCWWNGADEALDAIEQAGAAGVRASDVHVCFFPEAGRDLRAAKLTVLELPYVFARPEAPVVGAAPAARQIVYTGEVDVSDGCFAPLPSAIASALSARTTELAVAVTEGALSLHDADRTLRDETAPSVEAHRIALWALRNRVRFRLMEAIVQAFGDRVVLRGTDWQRAGFDAERTDFDRATRLAGYRAHRVALDLGSKSTHAGLYPRTAEIVAIAGGLVQFDCGAPPRDDLADWSAAVAPRRAASAAALVARVDEVLSAPHDVFIAQNMVMHEQYARLRLAVGRRFLDALLHAAR